MVVVANIEYPLARAREAKQRLANDARTILLPELKRNSEIVVSMQCHIPMEKFDVTAWGPIGPIADTDRHDFPRHVDKLVPGKAAVIQNVFVRFEDAVANSRMNCQMFSTGLSSGDFGGKGKSVMFETCHPA